MPKRKDIKKILIIGSGPISVEQGLEFTLSRQGTASAVPHETCLEGGFSR